MTPEAIEECETILDAANVDLKAFREETYKKLMKGSLQGVIDSIRRLRERGMWLEVTTLLVPGMNDGTDEITNVARYLAGVNPGIPWHISRFHPDYRFTHAPPTPLDTLRRARQIGLEAGLRYVYLGNVRGEESDHTRCPACGADVTARAPPGSRVVPSGRCPRCTTALYAVFRQD